MLAAAIRASLIEAGEPDTSIAAPPSTSQQRDSTSTPDKQHHQQQQQQQLAGPQVSPFQTSQPEQQLQQQQPAQHCRQMQKQKVQQHQLRFQEKELPDGHYLPLQHASAEQFRDSAAGMQDTGAVGMVGQGTPQGSSRQASNALPGGQLRTAWSSDVIVGRGSSEDVPKSGAGDTADIVSYSPQSSC